MSRQTLFLAASVGRLKNDDDARSPDIAAKSAVRGYRS